MDVASVVFAAVGALVGGFIGGLALHNRIEKRLSPDAASQWDDLGYWERYRALRELRRGRLPDDLSDFAGAEVAGALRVDMARRTGIVFLVLVTALLVAVAVFAAAAGDWVAVGFLALLALLMGVIAACQPLIGRRLERLAAQARAG